MTPGADAGLQTLPYNGEIVLHGLPSRHFQLIENMVVRAAHKDTRLLHADLLHQLKILLAGPDPARDLRKLVALLHTLVHGVPVLFAVQEKFALADLALRPAQPVKIVVNVHDLLRAVGRPGLLSVAERGVCDPDLVRHAVGHDPVVKCNLRYLVVVEKISEYVRLFYVHEGIHMLLKLKQICVFIKVNLPVLHVSSLL